MGSVSAIPDAAWRCAACALMADLEYRAPPAPSVPCAECGQVANPCAVLRDELRALHDEVRALRHLGGLATPRRPDAEEDAMTPIEVAGYLKMSVRAVYMDVRRGNLPAHRLGRRLRFRRSEIDAKLGVSR